MCDLALGQQTTDRFGPDRSRRKGIVAGKTTGVGRLFAGVALLEALTWIGLLVGMFLKYVTDSTEKGVQIFGPIHGGAFLLYIAVTLFAAKKLRWDGGATIMALLASIPPLVTIIVERVWAKRGWLDGSRAQLAPEGSSAA